MSDLTALFAAAREGRPDALGSIFEALYPELKSIARARLAQGKRLTVMDTTLLVHECFLRMNRLGRLDLDDRRHFLGYAARVIRTVIIDLVRQEGADKRGGAADQVTLNTDLAENLMAQDSAQADVLAVAQALESLEAMDPRLAAVVEMRYFAGFSDAEIAGALNITDRTVRRDWEKARALLMVMLQR